MNVHLHLAAAGGGSGGFGGGGGGGGGGGRGAGLYILFQILIRIALLGHGLGALVLLAVIVVALLITRVVPTARGFWSAQQDAGTAARRRTEKRQRRVELAAAEAAEDDPAFAPENVKRDAATLFKDIQHAWDRGDRGALEQLVAPDLLAEWERRLDDFDRHGWHNRVEPQGEPRVEYVGLKTDRVTVRIEAKLSDYVEDRYGSHIKRRGRITENVNIREFWMLARRKGRWILLSIEQGAEGAHALGDQIVATPWSDEQALRDEALVEQAVADAPRDGTSPAELAGADLHFEGDARHAALDLSLADGRFAPDVLEVAARRAVSAWAEAVDGNDAALSAVADAPAIEQLLYAGDASHRTRLVIRGPRVRQIAISDLDAASDPATMTLAVELEGRRYLEDRQTAAVLAGSRHRPSRFTEHWTLALTGDARQPWRIVRAGTPALSG